MLIRLLNNQFHPTFNVKRIEFNLPTHFNRMPLAFHYLQLCIDASILSMGAPLRRFPRTQSERFLCGAICLLSLNIVSIFQSQLSTCYVRPMYYKNIDTLQQFAETERKILIKYPAMMTDLFPEDSSDLFKTLFKRMILIQNTDLIAKDITDKYGMAGVTRRTSLKLSQEDDQVHLIPECPRSYNLAYVHSKHWIFAPQLNDLILFLLQGGIVEKWINDIDFDVKLKSLRRQTAIAHHRVLTLDDLCLSFMILGAGSLISASFLLIEIFWSRRCRR